MLQEIRQRYYYPNMAKHVKKWVEGCEECAKDKRVPNATITPELLNLPEWDLGPEDAMQIDLLPNLPPSGGFENVLTAIDVISRYLFAYPLTDASAINLLWTVYGNLLGLLVQVNHLCTLFAGGCYLGSESEPGEEAFLSYELPLTHLEPEYEKPRVL